MATRDSSAVENGHEGELYVHGTAPADLLRTHDRTERIRAAVVGPLSRLKRTF